MLFCPERCVIGFDVLKVLHPSKIVFDADHRRQPDRERVRFDARETQRAPTWGPSPGAAMRDRLPRKP